MKKIYKATGIVGAMLLASGGVQAATSQTTFGVSATVADSCSVTATDLAFGSIDPLVNKTTATDATSTIDVTCANGTTYDVGLDAGGATGATVTTRQMVSGANLLDYALYSDTGRATNWGNTIDPTTGDTVAGTGSGAAQTLTVYGRVPAGQETTPTGAYADTITVTVTY